MSNPAPALKPCTRIEVLGFDAANREIWQPAKIVRTTRAMLPMLDGFCPVLFDDGEARLLVHSSRFRVVTRPKDKKSP